MFVCINFYFRPYDFLCSPLSFFENPSSISCINKCHFGVVKIVSVSPPIFTSQNIQKSSINITTLDQRHFASMKMCILNSSVKMRRLSDIRE